MHSVGLRKPIHRAIQTLRWLLMSLLLFRRSQHFWEPQNTYSTGIAAIRHHSSWVSSISRFSRSKSISNAPARSNNEVVIDNDVISEDATAIKDLKHYSRTSDMSERMKQKMTVATLNKLASSEVPFTQDAVQAVDQAVSYLHKLNGHSFTKTDDTFILDRDVLIKLFLKSGAVLSTLNRLWIPHYMSLMMKAFVNLEFGDIPPRVISYMVRLGSLGPHGSLSRALATLTKHIPLTRTVVDDLVIFYDNLGKLNLSFFESVLTAVKDAENDDLGDYFYDQLVLHVESLYSKSIPLVHEYLDHEKSLDRVMMILGFINSHSVGALSIESMIRLFTLAKDLESAADLTGEPLSEVILSHLEKAVDSSFGKLESAISAQDAGNESLIENLLLASYPNHLKLFKYLADKVQADSSTYSPETVIQSKVLSALTMNEKDLEEYTKNSIDQADMPMNDSKLYEKLIRAAMARKDVSTTGTYVDNISDYMRSRGARISLGTYKCLIDRALKDDDVETAVHLFEDSLEDLVNWTDHLEPAVLKTLNSLIVAVANTASKVDEAFRVFLKVKQHMSTTPININAICSLADRMLDSECVGDLIEMMKRELPKIGKNSLKRLPLDKPWGTKYREFFDKLQNYVTTYTNEATFETNWVLYGELHKYFNAPFESYLPTMKFFCEKDRLNAALIIFRQVKRLNELHGDHNFPPPLRDMYMYLFQVFGDKLYEEGVDELHGYLKMDVALPKLDVALENTILNAFSNLQEVAKARDLFLAILSRNNGKISPETAEIMIKTFTYSDLVYVEKFWNNLSLYGVTPNYSIFRQYLIAHVYNGYVEEACKLVKEMDDYGLELSSDTLLALHNYCLEDYHQKEVAEWAEKTHKELWAQAVNSGLLRQADNYVPDRQLLE